MEVISFSQKQLNIKNFYYYNHVILTHTYYFFGYILKYLIFFNIQSSLYGFFFAFALFCLHVVFCHLKLISCLITKLYHQVLGLLSYELERESVPHQLSLPHLTNILSNVSIKFSSITHKTDTEDNMHTTALLAQS